MLLARDKAGRATPYFLSLLLHRNTSATEWFMVAEMWSGGELRVCLGPNVGSSMASACVKNQSPFWVKGTAFLQALALIKSA